MTVKLAVAVTSSDQGMCWSCRCRYCVVKACPSLKFAAGVNSTLVPLISTVPPVGLLTPESDRQV